MSGTIEDSTLEAAPQTDMAGNPIDMVDEAAVKEGRRSLTRGPVAVALLFLASAGALIWLGGFWAYPTWQELEKTKTDIANDNELFADKSNELKRVKTENETKGKSEMEVAFEQKISVTNLPAKNVRDLVILLALDPSTQEDDLTAKNFAFAEAKAAGDYVVIPTTLNIMGSETSVLRLLESANDPNSGRRLANAIDVKMTWANTEEKMAAGASPAEARFRYLLRQKGRHLITDDESEELGVALDARAAKYQQTREQLDRAMLKLRELQSERATEGLALITRTEALPNAEAEVARLKDQLSALAKDAQIVTQEVSVALKLELYAEQDPNAKADPKAKAAKPAAATPATPAT